MRDDVRILNRAYELFDDASHGSGDSLKRKLVRLIGDEEFLMAIYRPDTKATTKEQLNTLIGQVFDVASKKNCINTIAEAISDNGYYELGRPSACFLVTLVNLGMATIDSKATDLGRAKDHEEISTREYDKGMRRLENFQDDLQVLLKYAKRIVKGKAVRLSDDTGLPKTICTSALFTVPGAEYLDTYKIGFYLNTLLGNLYGYVNMSPEDFDDFDDVNWKEFFRAIFGRERLPDVASLILLEGVDKIDKYENYRDVRACWDSITQFALKTLNQSPASIRDQMIELYLKRVNKMLADHDINLRVDLRMIDDFRFDKLAETVRKYKDKIDAIMKAAKTFANAKPESSPA